MIAKLFMCIIFIFEDAMEKTLSEARTMQKLIRQKSDYQSRSFKKMHQRFMK